MTSAFLTESTAEDLELEGIPLELYGRWRGSTPQVHTTMGFNLPVMDFEEWKTGRPDAPRRTQRSPQEEPSYMVDQENTRRILALVENLKGHVFANDILAMRQLAEIGRRIEVLSPLFI